MKREVPDYVAAYACALYDGGVGTWGDVTALVQAFGLGSYRYDRLARAALTWAATHVAPSSRRQLRVLMAARASEKSG